MAALIDIIVHLGRFGLFVVDSLRWGFRRPFRFRQIIEEIDFIGNQSLFIVALTATFTGGVFAFTSWLGFRIVGTTDLVGPAVGLALVLELSPVLTSLIIIGRAGAAMAAQLGTMRVTEQLDALEVMAVEPKQYLVAPKIFAATISLPLLVAIFNLIGNLGGYIVAVYVCDIDPGIYVYKLKMYMWPWDVYHGLIKSVFNGFILGTVGCYMGYNARNGANGVGKATNDAVVFAMVTVLVLDFFLSQLIPSGMRDV